MPWMSYVDTTDAAPLQGSEGGTIVADEEHDEYGARITLETDTKMAKAAITCGLYGWMMHTRFFRTLEEARREYEAMKTELAILGSLIPHANDPHVEQKKAALLEALAQFEEKFA